MLTDFGLNLASGAVVASANTLKIHSANPTATGTVGEIGSQAATYVQLGTAGEADLQAPVVFAIDASGGNVTVSHYSIWNGANLIDYNAFTTAETFSNSGDASINSAKVDFNNV